MEREFRDDFAGRPQCGAWALRIPPVGLEGELVLPEEARGIVLFAHGSGSGRHSPRNRHVAAGLQVAGLGTLLFDLLTEEEAADRTRVFDIPLLAERVTATAEFLHGFEPAAGMPLGLFGASTGAAAALVAAADLGARVRAVVSRGGRPDLAGDALERVRAPTLLIVGGNDVQVLVLNRQALERLTCPKALEVVPGAGHLFEETGTLDKVIGLARRWFLDHVRA
jgi:pimeloyl-ACP methyl ester carboxylesterase